MQGRSWLAAGILFVAALLAAAPAEAAPSRREIQARQEFAAGRYANALELFAELYAQTLHPTYLRNIARCHQELGDPDKAIASFRQYLSKARDLKAAERQEVEGFIADMEALKRRREEAARPAAAPPPPPVSLVARNTEQPPPPAMVTGGPEPERQPRPVYRRWWFWALVGGAVVAGGAGLWASGAMGGKDASCPAGFNCQ